MTKPIAPAQAPVQATEQDAIHAGVSQPVASASPVLVEQSTTAPPLAATLDALPWPPPGKDYGRDPVYKDRRDGTLRISKGDDE